VSRSTSWWPPVVACLALAGCSGGDPAQSPSATPSASAPAATSSATATTAPPPAPNSTSQSASKPLSPPPSTVPGACGTVKAASGLTLYVFDSSSGGVDCAAATKLVTDFQHKIAGRQDAASNEAVNETVDGWLCTSGPPAAQGGTTCSKGEQTVFAAVVPSE